MVWPQHVSGQCLVFLKLSAGMWGRFGARSTAASPGTESVNLAGTLASYPRLCIVVFCRNDGPTWLPPVLQMWEGDVHVASQ